MPPKTKNALILIAQIFLTVAAAVASVSLVYCVLGTDEPAQKKPAEPTRFEYEETKDWFLDSTLTEAQHIYYETQHKMK